LQSFTSGFFVYQNRFGQSKQAVSKTVFYLEDSAMDGYFLRVIAQTPTHFWINNPTVNEALLALENGATGCTHNPSYALRMLTDSEESAHTYKLLDSILAEEPDDNRALCRLQLELIRRIAESFLPLFEQSCGTQGYVTIQSDPYHEDTVNILKAARENCAVSPNIMPKIPVTEQGLAAISELLAENIPLTATEIMSVQQALDVGEACDNAATKPPGIRPVLYYAHIAGIFDEYIACLVQERQIQIPRDYVWQGGIAVARKVHAVMEERGYPCIFLSGGARDTHHFSEMVGVRGAITINWRNCADVLLREDAPVVQRFLRPVSASVLDALCSAIPEYRTAYEIHAIALPQYESFGPVAFFRSKFERAWSQALALIGERRQASS